MRGGERGPVVRDKLVGAVAPRCAFATMLAMRGVPIPAVHRLMGHSTIETTMRYAHLSPAIRKYRAQRFSFTKTTHAPLILPNRMSGA
jgi:site-specific recombinase XerD